ncbi:hypothetical protein BDW22DRAFT_1481194 [Trametopsis cervina]|nr:hypothetical protein BDW22DRAFT_1481194 [Trametopsis cervina]
MIPPSHLPRSSSPGSSSNARSAVNVTKMERIEVEEWDLSSIEEYAESNAGELMELEYAPLAMEGECTRFVITEHGWREPTAAEALAVTMPFQDPEAPLPTRFGMGFRDTNGQISDYTRQKNDDIGISPPEIMSDSLASVDVSTLDLESDGELQETTRSRAIKIKLPKTPERRKSTRSRKKSPPPSRDNMASVASRRRKTTETMVVSPSSSSGRTRQRNSPEIIDLTTIAESDEEEEEEEEEDDDDMETLVGSSPVKSPTIHKIRPPNSGGSSPLKPKSAAMFAGYQCQMPGCLFTASSPQHIKHHYNTFQHGRMQTRRLSRTLEN